VFSETLPTAPPDATTCLRLGPDFALHSARNRRRQLEKNRMTDTNRVGTGSSRHPPTAKIAAAGRPETTPGTAPGQSPQAGSSADSNP